MDLWLDHIGSMILIDFGGPQMPWEGTSVLFQVSICGNHLRSQRFSGTGLLHRQWWNYTTDTLQETFTLRKVFTCVFLTKSWGFLIRISHQCSFGIGGSYSIYSIYSMGTYNKPEWIKGIWISHGWNLSISSIYRATIWVSQAYGAGIEIFQAWELMGN